MRRFRVLFLVFAVALLAPLAFLVERALRSAALERELNQRVVAERVFDEMERALSQMLGDEEARPFEAYTATAPTAPFVIARFQIDPDGTLHSSANAPIDVADIVRGPATSVRPAPAASARAAQTQVPGSTVGLGAAAGAPRRNEAAAPSAFDALSALNKGAQQRVERQRKAAEYRALDTTAPPPPAAAKVPSERHLDQAARLRDEREFDADELPPFAGRLVDPRYLVLTRTAVHDARAFRQGVVVGVERLGDWLRAEGLGSAGLGSEAVVEFTAEGAAPPAAVPGEFVYQHRFAEPFETLTAQLSMQPLSGVGSTAFIYALAGLLLLTCVLGLAALYRMVAVVVAFAERRSNFAAAVSHELKTPLTAIRMYGEMLRDGMVPSEAKRDEYYRHITGESERLGRLIDNVLEFSRLEKGTRRMTLTTAPVAPVVGEIAELLRPHVQGQGFELHIETDGELPAACFERDALMQVLWNLVDNAVKYARDAMPRQVALRCWAARREVHVAVRDHGPGVAPRHLDKIFDPFYRGESELTRRSSGTGLGLALVRGLVERMGGRVSGRNVADGGFEVEIVLRAAA
jgi:signal transduction histidine kinase